MSIVIKHSSPNVFYTIQLSGRLAWLCVGPFYIQLSPYYGFLFFVFFFFFFDYYRHPEEMAAYEDDEYKQRLNVAMDLLRTALRVKRENDELRNSNKMRVRSLSRSRLSRRGSRSQVVSVRRGSQSISRVNQASLIRSDSVAKNH